jgi:hypothetical protein
LFHLLSAELISPSAEKLALEKGLEANNSKLAGILTPLSRRFLCGLWSLPLRLPRLPHLDASFYLEDGSARDARPGIARGRGQLVAAAAQIVGVRVHDE